MSSPVLGELLILFLLIMNCSRIFFLKYGKVDSLTILAPLCVVLSVLQIVSWNADEFSILLLIISLFAFFTNFRALLRFVSGLYVDHYSIAFKLGAFLILLFSIAEAAVLIYFFPYEMPVSKYGVTQEKFRVSGNFTGGFDEAETFSLADGVIYKFEPAETSAKKSQALILVSDKRGDSRAYLPYMILLAQKGYTVYTGDFYSKDVRWLHSFADSRFLRRVIILSDYFRNPVQFMAQKEFFAWNSSKEIEAVLNFARENSASDIDVQFGETLPAEDSSAETSPAEMKFFVVGDWMSNVALDDFVKSKPEDVLDVIKLTDFSEYTTPGFGFIYQVYPIEAFLMNRIRIRNNDEPKKIAELTAGKIKSIVGEPEEELAEGDGNTTGNEGSLENAGGETSIGEKK